MCQKDTRQKETKKKRAWFWTRETQNNELHTLQARDTIIMLFPVNLDKTNLRKQTSVHLWGHVVLKIIVDEKGSTKVDFIRQKTTSANDENFSHWNPKQIESKVCVYFFGMRWYFKNYAISKAHYFFKLGREKNTFVKFVFIRGWEKSEQTPPFLKTMKTCVENLKIV